MRTFLMLCLFAALFVAMANAHLGPADVCKSHKIKDDLSDKCPEGYECKQVGLSGHHICMHIDGSDPHECNVEMQDKWNIEELTYCCLHKNVGCPHSGEAEF